MIQRTISNLHSSLRIARVACVLLLLNSSAISQQLHFDFGPTKAQPGHKRVGSDTFYSKALGYGFEPDAKDFLRRKTNERSALGFLHK